MAMIETRQLHKRFGPKVAVESLDLEIGEGEFFCFLGPNGAGKTTTIKMLTGLLHPTGGTARIGGYDIQKQPVEAKRLLGYIPDTPFLYDRLTGREQLELVAGLYQMPGQMPKAELAERYAALLEQFELTHAADQRVGDYSHGMRQKLSFASTFLHDPKVVVVDEPWVGLDPKNIRAVKGYLKERTEEGVTVFMSTHTLSIAEEVADRVGIFHRGRLKVIGTVAEIKALARRPGSLEDVFLELTEGEGEP